MKLQLKPTILSYQLPEQVVLQFNGQYAKIPDPDGAIWALTQALDGTKNINGIIDHVLTRFPTTSPEAIQKVMDDIIKHKMVEVPEESLSTTLSEKLRTRLSRNIDFFGSMVPFGESKFAYQEKLQSSKVCVLGCGGLGTHILYQMTALGIRNLTILDFDKIELSNLNRQILYKEEDVGTEKVETAKKRLLEFNSQLEITTHRMRLTSADDVSSVIAGHDLVICSADKPANSIGDWVSDACVKHNIPWIVGGVDVRRSIFYSMEPGVSGCEECWLTSARAKNPLVNNITTMNKELDVVYESPAPAFVSLVAVTAGMIVSEAVKYLTKCQPPQLANKLKEFHFDDLTVGVAETWERNPSCRVCGCTTH